MSMVEWIDKQDKRGRYDAIVIVCAMTNNRGRGQFMSVMGKDGRECE